NVHHWTLARRRVHELGKALPFPFDATLQHIEGNGFDIDQVAHGNFTVRGPARRDTHAAIPHHHGRDAMPRRRSYGRIREDLRVVVSVRIDETRRYHAVGRVDDAFGSAVDFADSGDSAAIDGNVCPPPLRTGTVDDGTILDQEFVSHLASRVSRWGKDTLLSTAALSTRSGS